MSVTKFQPVLPVEIAPTDAELEFMEYSPAGLFPQNQNSNFGFIIRKLWCDKITDIAGQQTTMFNEKFPDTSTQFLDEHERQYGLPIAPSTLTIAQRRQQVINRIRVGPFTRTRRKEIVESFITATFGNPLQLVPAGIAMDAGGVPLYGETGDVSTLYRIVEDIGNFSYSVRIKNTVTPDDVGLHRELDRITPAHISYAVTYVATP
jgi:hypothetical protein